MLRAFPTIKQSLTLKERQKLTVDLAHYLQRVSEEKAREEELNKHIFTRQELCRHCINSRYEVGNQTLCLATNRMISDRHRGICEKFKEGYIKFCGEPKANFMSRGYAVAKLKMGVIGVTVDIMQPGSRLPADTTILGKTDAMAKYPELFAGMDVSADEPVVEAEPVEEAQ